MREITETKYALYHIKEETMLGYSVESNGDANFCNDNTYRLNTYSDRLWTTEDSNIAEWVRQFNVQWYNSDIDYPMCEYEPDELKVIKLEVQTTISDVDIKIPTIYEFYEAKYAEKEPGHWEYLKENMDNIGPYYPSELDNVKM